MIRRWREMDSNLYGAFPCQVVVFGLLPKAQEQQERYLYRSQYLEHLRENWAHVVNRHFRGGARPSQLSFCVEGWMSRLRRIWVRATRSESKKASAPRSATTTAVS